MTITDFLQYIYMPINSQASSLIIVRFVAKSYYDGCQMHVRTLHVLDLILRTLLISDSNVL